MREHGRTDDSVVYRHHFIRRWVAGREFGGDESSLYLLRAIVTCRVVIGLVFGPLASPASPTTIQHGQGGTKFLLQVASRLVTFQNFIE